MTNAQRVKQVRSRARIRKWEFRQRHLAHGAWHRLHLALAAAREAYVIDDASFDLLVAEGFDSDDRGMGLEPPKRIVWVTAERAATLTSAARLELRLDAAMLAARTLALVPFD